MHDNFLIMSSWPPLDWPKHSTRICNIIQILKERNYREIVEILLFEGTQ